MKPSFGVSFLIIISSILVLESYGDLGGDPLELYFKKGMGELAMYKIMIEEFNFYRMLRDHYRETLPLKNVKVGMDSLITQVYSYVQEYEEEMGGIDSQSGLVGKRLRSFDGYSHPVLAFQALRRKAKDMQRLSDRLIENDTRILEDPFYASYTLQGPSISDVEFYSSQLIKLIEFYNLNIEEFCNGVLGHVFTGVRLPPFLAAAIGFEALKAKRYATAVEFFASALDRKYEVQASAVETFELGLDYAISAHDRSFRKMSQDLLVSAASIKMEGVYWRSLTSQEEYYANRGKVELHPLHDVGMALEYSPLWKSKGWPIWRALEGLERLKELCLGNFSQQVSDTSDLVCLYSPTNVLVKMEILSSDSPVMAFHDFLSDTEIRILTQCLLDENDDLWSPVLNNAFESTVRRIENRLNSQLKLWGNLYEISNFRFNAFIPGDFFENKISGPEGPNPKSKMVAVFYLNEAEVGGRSVFHHLGVSLKMPRGSVLVFPNYSGEGSGTVHMECPVVLGRKYVFTAYLD